MTWFIAYWFVGFALTTSFAVYDRALGWTFLTNAACIALLLFAWPIFLLTMLFDWRLRDL